MKTYLSKNYYRAAELAQVLPVTEFTIRQWVKDNRIKPDLIIGGRMFFLKETVEQHIQIAPK